MRDVNVDHGRRDDAGGCYTGDGDMRRRTIGCVLCLGLLLLVPVGGVHGQQVQSVPAVQDDLRIDGPTEIEQNMDEDYDVLGLAVGDIPQARVWVFPDEDVRLKTALPWGGGPPYVSFRAKRPGLYRLWVLVDHKPKPPEGISSRDPWVHVPDELTWITIQVGPPAPLPDPPKLSVTDTGCTEGQPAVFRVGLSKPAEVAVSLTAQTADGEAAANSDYEPLNASYTIPVGQSELSISVATIDDSEPERDESFTLALTNVLNADVVRGTGTATIADNDAPPITQLSGVIVFDPEDTAQQDPVWSQIMFGPKFNDMLGDREWQPVAIDVSGAPPDWIVALVQKVKSGSLPCPHLFLLDQDHGVVWDGLLPKSIAETEAIVKKWKP